MLNKPLEQLTSEDDIIKCLYFMYEEGYEASKDRIRIRDRNASFFEGNHYQNYDAASGMWKASRTTSRASAWRARTQTADLYNNVTSLVPILNRAQPKIIVESEYPSDPVDIRDIRDGQIVGNMSGINGATAAEMMTDLLENMSDRRSDTFLNANIILESILGGTAFVNFRIMSGYRGTEIMPNLLMQEQFVGDPDAHRIWDFGDFLYIVITDYVSASNIKRSYGLDEHEYGTAIESRRGIVHRIKSAFSKPKQRADAYGMTKYPVRTTYYLQDVAGDNFENVRKIPAMKTYRTVNDQKLVLDNEPSMFWHKRFPVTAFQPMPLPFKAAGMSEVSQMIWSQMTVNMIQNVLLDNLRLGGSERVIAEEGAIKANKLSTDPGSISIAQKGALQSGGIQILSGKGPDGNIVNFRELSRQDMRQVAGDGGGLLAGDNPNNIKGAEHARIAVNTVLTKQQFKIANLDPAWRELAYQEVSNTQQFVDFDNINFCLLYTSDAADE